MKKFLKIVGVIILLLVVGFVIIGYPRWAPARKPSNDLVSKYGKMSDYAMGQYVPDPVIVLGHSCGSNSWVQNIDDSFIMDFEDITEDEFKKYASVFKDYGFSRSAGWPFNTTYEGYNMRVLGRVSYYENSQKMNVWVSDNGTASR